MRRLTLKKSYISKASLIAIASVFAVALTPLPHTASAAGSVVGELQGGESLNRGETVTSQNGQYKLKMQGDGNLVQYNAANNAIWALGVIDSTASKFSVQTDGNFVLYNQAGKVVWQSLTFYDTGTKKLSIQNDGNMVGYITESDGFKFSRWSKDSTSNLGIRGEMSKSEMLISKTGKYRMRVQQDGNMVIYTQGGKAVWSAKPYNSTAYSLVVASYGDVYLDTTNYEPSWSTNTSYKPLVDRLTLQDDGNLVLYNEKGQGVWHR